MRGFVIIPVVVAILVTALSSVFIVDERKKALNEWARLLAALEEGWPDYNVVPLKKGKAG